MSGLDRLLELPRLPRAGSKVGFLGHHASLTRDGIHAIDQLLKRSEWDIVRLFSPEHGFFGTSAAGEPVANFLHPVWGLPVHSLYGEHRSPLPEWLTDLDLMVIDLQDLGVRCYTYASTLLLMMRACARAEVSVIVLDRSTPLAGIVDGPELDPACQSFVGMIDLPLVFGLGQGDLAHFLNMHDSECRKLDVQIFRDSETTASEAEWVPPSPAIVSPLSAQLYPVTVWCEAIPEVDVNRGGPTSFMEWTMPDFPPALLDAPPSFTGMIGEPVERHIELKAWRGLQFRITHLREYRPLQNALILLCALRDHLGAERLFDNHGARPEFFDKLMGGSSVRHQLQKGESAETICRKWRTSLPTTKSQ